MTPGPPPVSSGRISLSADRWVGGRAGWLVAIPDAFRRTPRRVRPRIAQRCIFPPGRDGFDLALRVSRSPVSGRRSPLRHVTARYGCCSTTAPSASRTMCCSRTGFEVDVRQYPFLAPDLVASVDRVDGYPQLGPGLESSVPGLHFLGAPAASSFGPVMRFVVGTWYAAPALTLRALGRRQPAFRPAFPR